MARKRWTIGTVIALLLLMTVEVLLSTRQQSPGWDEGSYIYSGYMNWKQGEYTLIPQNPPLVKLVATLPLLPLDLKVAPREGRYFESEAYFGGRELLFRNDPKYGGHYSADTLLFRTHMVVLVFALMLALLLFLASSEMFGAGAGLIAVALFVLDPSVLANAPVVATDIGAACGFFATVYAFYRFVKYRSWQRMAVCGLAAGIALATKDTALLLLPILLVLATIEIAGRWTSQRIWPKQEAATLFAGLAVIATIAVTVLWAVYSFRYAMHPVGMYLPPLADEMAVPPPLMQRAISLCAEHHLLPESYLYGLVYIQQAGRHIPSYIFGRLYEHGQWFYFPALLCLKWTAGTLGLLALAVFAFATGRVQRPREVTFLALPAVLYLAVAMATPVNFGVRHVLPVFPFTFALAAGGAAWLVRQRRAWIYPVAALLLWHGIDSVQTFPNYTPYANVFWGGPTKTHLYFTDSATDWGQQLKWTRQWVDAHNVKECWFAYYPAPVLLPSDYGIPCKLLPTAQTLYHQQIDVPPVVHGPVLISFSDLAGLEFGTKLRNPYRSLSERTPDDVIANGIAVFHGDIALPEASALEHEQRSNALRRKDPPAALREARQAVALAPGNFDANLALGDAATAVNDRTLALAAYRICMARIAEMEPSAQQLWSPIVESRLAAACADAPKALAPNH
jgi:4-amino-4-deoxy-L-arabinose transferase-like glycosyltransferase